VGRTIKDWVKRRAIQGKSVCEQMVRKKWWKRGVRVTTFPVFAIGTSWVWGQGNNVVQI